MASTTDSTELAVPDNAGLAARKPTPELVAQAYAAVKDNELPPNIGDPEIMSRMILERIEQGTLDDSLAPSEKLPNWARDYEDVPVAVYGFHMNPSTIDDENGDRGVYAIVELAIVGSGEIVTVQTGAKNVLMQLVKAWEEGRYPFTCKLEVVSTGTAGRKTFWLRDV